MGQTLLASCWRVKLQSRALSHGQGWMVAAKAGAANKLGYIAAHSAIVMICIGGLLDDNERKTIQAIPFLGDLPVVGALFRKRERTANKTDKRRVGNPATSGWGGVRTRSRLLA